MSAKRIISLLWHSSFHSVQHPILFWVIYRYSISNCYYRFTLSIQVVSATPCIGVFSLFVARNVSTINTMFLFGIYVDIYIHITVLFIAFIYGLLLYLHVDMRCRDEVLARRLISLLRDISEYRLEKTIAEARDAIDEAVEQEEEKHDDFAELHPPDQLCPILKEIGVSRRKLQSRRFWVLYQMFTLANCPRVCGPKYRALSMSRCLFPISTY